MVSPASSSPLPSSLTGTLSPLKQETALGRVVKLIAAGEWQEAYEDLLLALTYLEKGDHRTVYRCVSTLLERLSQRQVDTLILKLHFLLDHSSDLRQEQEVLAIYLAQTSVRHIEEQHPFTDNLCLFRPAMDYYAKAIQLANNVETDIHESASALLLQSYLGVFAKELEQARSQQDVEKFGSLILRLNEIREVFCCTPKDIALLRKFYRQARRIYNDILPDKVSSYTTYGPHIDQGLSNESFSDRDYATKRYVKKLHALRKEFSEISSSDTREFQKKITHLFRELFGEMLADAFVILGPPPCHYDLRAMGSLGREEPSPFSDVELLLLIQENQPFTLGYFKRLIQFLDLQIRSLGESADIPLVFSCLGEKCKEGFRLDSGGDPSREAELLGTPEQIAALQETDFLPHGDIFGLPQHTALKSISLLLEPSSLFDEYERILSTLLEKDRHGIKFFKYKALTYLKERLKSYSSTWTRAYVAGHHNIKEEYIVPLFYTLSHLALYFEVRETNTLDIINRLREKDVLTPSTALLLQTAISDIYGLRVPLPLDAWQQKDEQSVPRGSDSDAQLERIYWLILRPLYASLDEALSPNKTRSSLPTQKDTEQFKSVFHCLDLGKRAFKEAIATLDPSPQSFVVIKHLASTFVDQEDVRREFIYYFEILSKNPRLEPLRQAFFDSLKKTEVPHDFLKTLSLIPNQAGLRLAYAQNYNELYALMTQVTQRGPANTSSISWVKVKSPTFPNGHRYLKPEVIEALFDSEGNIKKSPDSKSVHAVTSTQGLYFKQMPFQPLMEYAIHNLFFRIGGHLTATNELVLLEISLGEDHKITYPVLISREVRGSTLQKIAQDNPRFEEDVNKTRLTWLLLCSILTRPGDGRLSNYILSDGNIIFCIDNDISFVEPVIGRVFKEIKFCSALFCLCTSLDQDVLRQFAALNAGAVLNGWIDEVIKTEEKYKKLFTEEERKSLFAGEIISRQRLYRKKSGHIFTPTILLVEGDLAILNQQFIHLQYYLQRQLQNGQEITMHDLLAHLITLTDKKDSSVGYDVCKAYTTQATSPLEKRLEKAVGKRDQSQTPAEYLKSAFRTPPSWEDIEKKQLCSPLKAKEELLFSLRCADVAEGKIDPEGASTLRANFIRLRSVSDPSRQDKVLRALQFWASQNSYTEIIITHCSGLNSETLEPFLQPTLEHLDISHSPQIRSRAIVHIQERCPRLKKLILEGCSELDDIKPRASPIFFASLEELSLGSCNNLRSLNIKAPQLKVLHLQKTSSLLTAQLDVLRFPRIDFEDSSCIDIQHNNLQEICQERRDFENARHFYTQLLASLERKPPTAITGVALYRLGWISAHLKLSHEAIAYYERSLALYKELKDFPAMSAVLRNLVILLMSERDTPLNRDKEKRYQREYLELPQAKDISWQLETDKESALKDVQKNCLVLQLLGLKLSQDDAIIRVSPFFGRGKWLKFFGKVAIEPPLPLDIQEILSGPCPIFPGKRVIETHFLTLIPEGMTLERLEALTLNPREGNKMGFRYKDDTTWAQHSKTPSGRAHWVLMTNDVIPGSRGKSWKDQQALAAKFKGQGYELLSGIEAATCVLLEYVQTGRRFYTTDPYTFTRCIEQVKVGSSQWPLAIGGFAPGGVVVNAHVGYRGNRGVGVARKFH